MPTSHEVTPAESIALDPVKRASLRGELLQLMRLRLRKPGDSFQFEGLDLQADDPKSLALRLVIEDIIRDYRGVSLVQWPGGPAIVRTADVDALAGWLREINEGTDFIIRGGSEQAADVSAFPARPTKPVKE